MIVSRTPLRISFAGGGSDIPYFYEKNSYGCVLSSLKNCDKVVLGFKNINLIKNLNND